ARAELGGSNHDAGGELDAFVGGARVIACEAAAGAKEQGSIFFGKKAALAQVVPDEAIGAGEAERVAVTQKFRESKGAAGPDVAIVISSEHINVERGQPPCQAIVSDLSFTIHEAQATETKSVGVVEPDFIGTHGSGLDNFVLQQTVGSREMQPVLSVKAGYAAPANGPKDAVRARSEAADALVNFRWQRHIHELERPLRRARCFNV